MEKCNGKRSSVLKICYSWKQMQPSGSNDPKDFIQKYPIEHVLLDPEAQNLAPFALRFSVIQKMAPFHFRLFIFLKILLNFPATLPLSMKLCWFHLSIGQAEGQDPWASCKIFILANMWPNRSKNFEALLLQIASKIFKVVPNFPPNGSHKTAIGFVEFFVPIFNDFFVVENFKFSIHRETKNLNHLENERWQCKVECNLGVGGSSRAYMGYLWPGIVQGHFPKSLRPYSATTGCGSRSDTSWHSATAPPCVQKPN